MSRLLPKFAMLEIRSLDVLKGCIREAVQHNDIAAMSYLLSLDLPQKDAMLEHEAEALIELSIVSNDAAECAFSLLNYLEELRRLREDAEQCQHRTCALAEVQMLHGSIPKGLALPFRMVHGATVRFAFCRT